MWLSGLLFLDGPDEGMLRELKMSMQRQLKRKINEIIKNQYCLSQV